MKWPRFSDLVVFRPTAEDMTSAAAGDELSLDDRQRHASPASEARSERWRRIRFDNAIRLWVALPTYLTCFALWAGGAIDSLLPMTAVILAYGFVLVAAFTAFFNLGFSRAADYVLGGIDLISMSAAVYLTGATASPLYFIYFVPVVIHAFHRDWDLILFSGFGGVVLYGFAVVVSLSNLSSASVADLCARLVFMLLTVAIACLGLSVLRKEEERTRRRTARLRAASALSQRLIAACSITEIQRACEAATDLLTSALSSTRAAVQFVFSDDRRSITTSSGVTVIPIASNGDEILGRILVSRADDEPMNDADLSYLNTIARSVALCLRRQKGIDELGRSVELGTAVAAMQMAAERSDRAAQSTLLEAGMCLIRSDRAALFLWNARQRRLEATAWMGAHSNLEKGFLSGQGVVGESYLRKEALRASDIDAEGEVRSLLAVPLLVMDGEVLGVLALSRLQTEEPHSDEDALIASAFACRAAQVLRSAMQRASDAPPVSPRLAA